MTWFRCGGIPVTLKNAMNSVLNKKFGTTGQNYPPNGWPDDVNLMGPLPEGTASGSIANFSDGADDVPMPSVIAHIAPTLTGINAVSMKQSGKNLASLSENTKKESQNCTYTFNNGGIDIVATGSYSRIAFTIPLVIGVQYTFSFSGYASGDYKRVSLRYVSTWSDFFYNQTITDTETSYNYTFTASQDHVHIGFYVTASSISGNMNIKDVQIEVGSTPTQYTAYEAQTQYTANLGRTIYGGQADIVNGIGTDENGDDFTFDGQEIPSLLGVNNLWHDAGNTEAVYRRDIDLALQAVSSSRGLMMASRPVTQLVGEESDPDQVNELVEDDENDIREQLNEVVENDETEQEGEDDAR